MKTFFLLVFAGLTLTVTQAQQALDQQTISHTETAGTISDRMATEQITAYNTVEQNAKAHYTAGQAITLQPGFTAQAGSVFTARIGKPSAKTTRPEMAFSARAYPNPFLQTTTIEYTLPQSGQVSFTLVDEQGHVLRQETSNREAGRQELSLTGADLTQGTYFYQIRLNNYQQTIRLLKTQ